MAFRFAPCGRQRAAPIAKADSKKGRILERLRTFLEEEEPEAIQWLVRLWDAQGQAVTYAELQEAILRDDVSPEQLGRWQIDYAEFVNARLAPRWEQAMKQAATDRFAGALSATTPRRSWRKTTSGSAARHW